MNNETGFGGIDRFRIAAALMIVGIHTYPFSSLSDSLNFYLIHVLARVAVPFFLMTTGYFFKPSKLMGFIKKTLILYGGAILLYIPINIYSGHYSNGYGAALLIREIIFDGPFYHLWYLPASVIGVFLVSALSRIFSKAAVLGITGFLYLLGLLGDSYYGVVTRLPLLNDVYNTLFSVFSYTRNGLFYAPVFIALGMSMAKKPRRLNKETSLTWLFVSVTLMFAEGYMLRALNFQRHDSMYLSLLPCAYFLFEYLRTCKNPASPLFRGISMWVYVLHPLAIIVVRVFARLTGLTDLLVNNSLTHYILVCLSSVSLSWIITVFMSDKTEKNKTARAWIELDMENLHSNVRLLKSHLPESCSLMPAIKANAYGHGAKLIAKELNAMGIRSFCVATIKEGIELRKAFVKGEILILGYTHPDQFPLLRRYNLTQTVIDYQFAKELNAFGRRLNVHVKIDTGMRRLGERAEDAEGILEIFNLKNLRITGVYSHLCADAGADKSFTKLQIDRFNKILNAIDALGFKPRAHLQSSNSIFNCPFLSYEMARPGIALYGMFSDSNSGLRPVLSLKARIAAVKTLYAGESAGYGQAFTADKNMKIAVITIGYGDGLPRNLSCGGGYVLINGRKAPIIGRVCMDQTTVDVTDIDGVNQGGEAVIIGESNGARITACEIAGQSGTIANEILCRLSERIERFPA